MKKAAAARADSDLVHMPKPHCHVLSRQKHLPSQDGPVLMAGLLARNEPRGAESLLLSLLHLVLCFHRSGNLNSTNISPVISWAVALAGVHKR